MRKTLACLLSVASMQVVAQQPPKLEPLPAPPPPPGVIDDDGPRVNISNNREDQVEEMRQNGRVVMIKVTPPGGEPYYLIDMAGNGQWIRRDALTPSLSVPQWTIKTFD
jgi:hypothetical protein